MRPDAILPALLRSDPARPRITCYDDASGERIELSGKVLDNWVAKAANLLQDDYDAGPGTRVALDLPPHWRALYWALAVWRTGATLVVGTDGDVVVTTDPAVTAERPVVVTLAALARSSAVPLPSGAVDEARELAGYADHFDAYASADDSDPALASAGGEATYADVVPGDGAPSARVHTSTEDLASFLRLALRTYAADGSLVLSRGAAGTDLTARLAAEGVTELA